MKVIAIDLDGTLAAWAWSESFEQPVGDWLPYAKESVRQILEDGHRIVVHTCRATWPAGGGIDAVKVFLESGGFVPYTVTRVGDMEEWLYSGSVPDPTPGVIHSSGIGVWYGLGKPIANVYIDDRGLRFENNWPHVMWILRHTNVI